MQFCENSHLIILRHRPAFGHFMIPFASKVAFLGNDLAIKYKRREFMVTLSVHHLNFSSVN